MDLGRGKDDSACEYCRKGVVLGVAWGSLSRNRIVGVIWKQMYPQMNLMPLGLAALLDTGASASE